MARFMPSALNFWRNKIAVSDETANKRDFRKAYNAHVDILKKMHGPDEAMKLAVGEQFDAFGVLERELLIQYGLESTDYVIDVGCGSGRLAKPLSEYLTGRYLGTDIVPDLVGYARKLVPRADWRFEVADGLHIPEQDGNVDLVRFFSVFTHLLHEHSFVYLCDAKRVLRPGGKIIFSFLEFVIPSHWAVFESSLNNIDGSDPLNTFLLAETPLMHGPSASIYRLR